MKHSKYIVLITAILIFSACKKQYEYKNAFVYKVEYNVWGMSYRANVFYCFSENDQTYYGDSKVKGMYSPPQSWKLEII